MKALIEIWSPADVAEAAELAAQFPSEPILAPVIDIRTREVIA